MGTMRMQYIATSKECTVYGEFGTVLRWDRLRQQVSYCNLVADNPRYQEMLRLAHDVCQ